MSDDPPLCVCGHPMSSHWEASPCKDCSCQTYRIEDIITVAQDALDRICKAAGCENIATVAFDWPGQSETKQCVHHASWAHHIAQVLGFTLRLHPIPGEAAALAVQLLDFAHADDSLRERPGQRTDSG